MTKSPTARFGAHANPLAYARGSDPSPDREGGVALHEYNTAYFFFRR
jgi:hypothetical protein